MNCPSCGARASVAYEDLAWYVCGSCSAGPNYTKTSDLCDARRELRESNEYARKLNLKISDLCAERDAAKALNEQWKHLAEMLAQLQFDEFAAGGEALIDQHNAAQELYAKLKGGAK